MLKLIGKTIMITGGAGFIGSHLVERIVQEKPSKIVVVDNLFLGREENLNQVKNTFSKFKFINGDASNYDFMKNIMIDEMIDVVYDLAAIPLPASLIMPKWSVDVNVSLASVLSELLRKNFYKTLVHFSSSEAYGTAKIIPMNENHPIDPETPYAASKVSADYIITSYINTFGIDATIVRPFNNYGPRQNKKAYAGIIPIVVNKVIKGEDIIIYGDGEQTRDFIYVEDTVDAAIRVYEEENTRGKIVNIASGVETSINKLVRKILFLMKSNADIIYDKPRPGDVRRHCADILLAKTLLGFKPKSISNKNLQETINYYIQTNERGDLSNE
jgi:UDP-glucose 4-epimerase